MLAVAERPGMKVVVLGGGLLGLEAAAGLKARGMSVAVLHLMGHLMERQLDPARGPSVAERTGGRAASQSIARADDGHSRSQASRGRAARRRHDLSGRSRRDGDRYQAGDARCHRCRAPRRARHRCRRSNADVRSDILATGECVEHAGVCYGFVDPIYNMAAVAARTLSVNRRHFVRSRLGHISK